MSSVGDDHRITITVLRRNFHRVIREVEQGSTFIIVRRGRAVARLVPFTTAEPTMPVFNSGIPDLAARAEGYLEGFGEA